MMKKRCFLWLLVLACIAPSFSCNSKPTTPPAGDKQEALTGADIALFDNGKLSFYNSSNNTLVPLTVEKDFVVDGVFGQEDYFYYTVAIKDKLYLKRVQLSAPKPKPEKVTDWGLQLNQCFLESCDKAAMTGYAQAPVIKIEYDLDEEYCEFMKERYYHLLNQTMSEEMPDGLVLKNYDDDEEEGDETLFYTEEVEDETASEDEEGYKNYYYYIPKKACLSDQIDFDALGGYYQPTFELRSISPTRDGVVFAGYTDWGHVGHGPLCYATLDGKVQKILTSDVVDAYWGWLSDGRVAFVNHEGSKILAPDGTEQLISTAKKLVTLK